MKIKFLKDICEDKGHASSMSIVLRDATLLAILLRGV